MKLWQFGAWSLVVGASMSLTFLSGCGGDKPTGGTTTKTDDSKPKDDTPKDDSGKPAAKKAVMAGKATIKGVVKLDGTVDVAGLDAKMKETIEKDGGDSKAHCLAMDSGEQQWKFDAASKGLQNVVVFLVPESGTFFACSDSDEGVKAAKEKEEAKVTQPYCAFHPHVSVLFPQYLNDKGKKVKTGQKLVVYNDTNETKKPNGISHNTSWEGNGTKGNQTVQAGSSVEIKDLVPSNVSPLTLKCDIHKWMTAYVWVLDHPYFAVTNAKGEFEIKNAPVGTVKIIAWHEAAASNFLNKDGPKGEKIELKEGENKKDFTAKP